MNRNAPAILNAIALAILITVAAYWWNRPVDPPGAVAGAKFSSLSYAPFAPGQSPLRGDFATEAQIEADLALLSKVTSTIRIYAALETQHDIAPIARKYGLKVWQGMWLSGDRAKNEAEMAKAIQLARDYPDVITRVVVGNEVLLRRDLPTAELIADIERVKSHVRQPVAYADVWEFWKQFPEVAAHVDVMMIHLLPYWEDVPTGIDHAVAHVGEVYDEMVKAFPGKTIVIGETGWPSRGRERADAVPGRVQEAQFLRDFLHLAKTRGFDYNFIEAFDQDWKYANEGTVGASWGVFTRDRELKIPASGPLQQDPQWLGHTLVGLLVGAGFTAIGLFAARDVRAEQRVGIAVAGMVLGAAWAWAAADVDGITFDIHTQLAAVVNLLGQGLLACLLLLRLAGVVQATPWRRGAAATRVVRDLVVRRRVPELRGLLEDVYFVFVWTAVVLQLLLVFGPRYREFPTSSFAVPLLVCGVRIYLGDLRWGDGMREEYAVSILLIGGAIASAVEEGYLNTQSLIWCACALFLAVPVAARCIPRKTA